MIHSILSLANGICFSSFVIRFVLIMSVVRGECTFEQIHKLNKIVDERRWNGETKRQYRRRIAPKLIERQFCLCTYSMALDRYTSNITNANYSLVFVFLSSLSLFFSFRGLIRTLFSVCPCIFCLFIPFES